MKKLTKLLCLLFPAAITLFANNVIGSEESHEDKTLSPYFIVKSDDSDMDQLPLKSTSADVEISGVIADVKVTQVYVNKGKEPLEAIYIFPASTRAAVYALKMTIGERVINAKIKKREDARREYNKAKQQGKSASLLEQQRPNVFQMNVANIMPGDVINVELSYTELLVPVDKTYEFVYPTVVGPRYSNQPAETASLSENWVQNPYLHEGQPATYKFDINVSITAGLPIRKISCSSHDINVNFEGPSIAAITLDESEAYGGNRDYILQYRLDGEKIESGLLLYQGEKENFFLLMMQPPERVSTEQIPGREYIFIVDVSGSMRGFPLDTSKKLLKDLVGNLRPTDKFNVLLFAGRSSIMSKKSVPATSANIRLGINLIEKPRGGGGTQILPALKKAFALPMSDSYSRSIVIVTDGLVTVEEQAFDLIRKNLGDANVFTFGIGSSVNRHIIEGMARAGMGEPFIVTKPAEAPAKAEAFRRLIQFPVLTNIKADFGKFDTYDVEPQGIPDIFAQRPVMVFGKWRGSSKGRITLSGISGTKPWSKAIDVKKVKPSETNQALRYLWARHRIKMLSDYNVLRADDERTQEVTSLGLAYNLLTAYTSFIAIDTQVRNKDGKVTTIKQPLPLPQGVSDYAVGRPRYRSSSGRRFTGLLRGIDMAESTMATAPPVIERQKDIKNFEIDKIEVTGCLSKKDVEKLVHMHIDRLKQCYLKNGIKGKCRIEFKINASGEVKDVKVVSGKTNHARAEDCFVKEINKWHFPQTRKNCETTVTVSIVYRP